MSYDTASGPTLWTPPDTSAPETDQRTHWQLISELVADQLAPWLVYDYGQVPGLDGNAGKVPRIFVVLTVGRRYAGPRRAGRSGRSGWRLTTRYVGHTPDETRWAQDRTTLALDEARLLVGDFWSTPLAFEDEDVIGPDQEQFSGYASWTYVL